MDYIGELERLVADLYAYKWFFLAGALIVLAAISAFGYIRGWHLVIWRHAFVSGSLAIVVLAVIVPTGWYLVSPLFERSSLDEASPLVAAAGDLDTGVDSTPMNGPSSEPTEPSPMPTAPPGGAPAEATPMPQAFESRVTHRGEWEGADDFHFGRGQAILIETAPGEYTLRVEDFSVRNGPDLFVYLSPSPDDVDGALNLGDLKATDGAFNYEVPPGMDISQFTNAVVWCRRFSVLFAVAPLTEP